MFKLLKAILGFGDVFPSSEPVRRPSYVYAWEAERFAGIEQQPVDSLFRDAQSFYPHPELPWLRDIGHVHAPPNGTPQLAVTVVDMATPQDEVSIGPPWKCKIAPADLIEAYREARIDKHLCCDDQLELAGLGAGCVYDFSVILQYACYGEGLFGTDGYGRDF